MARTLKKGPFVDPKLLKKIEKKYNVLVLLVPHTKIKNFKITFIMYQDFEKSFKVFAKS